MSARYQIRGENASEIAESLERAIDRGALGEDDRLPTIRELAERLSVSPTTVNAAYAALRKRGRIGGNRRGGSRVVGRPRYPTAAAPLEIRRGARDLVVANPDPALLPPLRPFVERAIREGRLYGAERVSARLAALARKRLGAEGVDARHLAVASGALDAVERALFAHVVAGDTVALEDPGYPPYRELCTLLGLRTIAVAVDAAGIVPDSLRAALRERAKAVVLVPRAQNPTGAAIDARRATALRRVLAEAPQTLVIEDDYLGDVAGAPLYSIGSGRLRWAYVRSFAKILGPDLRCAIVAGDELTLARLDERQRVTSGWTSGILQETAARMLADRSVARTIARAARTYADRREALVRALAQRDVAVASGAGGFSVWVPVDDELAALRALDRAGFAADGGARYRVAARPGIRIVTTTLTASECERIAQALAALAAARARATAP